MEGLGRDPYNTWQNKPDDKGSFLRMLHMVVRKTRAGRSIAEHWCRIQRSFTATAGENSYITVSDLCLNALL